MSAATVSYEYVIESTPDGPASVALMLTETEVLDQLVPPVTVSPIDSVITGRITVADASTGQLGAVPVTPPSMIPPPVPDAAGTMVLPAVKAPRAGEVLATGVVRLARLVPQNPEAGGQTGHDDGRDGNPGK